MTWNYLFCLYSRRRLSRFSVDCWVTAVWKLTLDEEQRVGSEGLSSANGDEISCLLSTWSYEQVKFVCRHIFMCKLEDWLLFSEINRLTWKFANSVSNELPIRNVEPRLSFHKSNQFYESMSFWVKHLFCYANLVNNFNGWHLLEGNTS